VRKKLEQLKLTENTDLSRDIKRLRDEMDDAKRKLETLAGRADQTDSRLEKIETNARHFKMR
jgi:chromosome segregation ATPase